MKKVKRKICRIMISIRDLIHFTVGFESSGKCVENYKGLLYRLEMS